MAKATEFGKALRRMRIDRDESSVTMARNLGYSTSFLSAVELGRKSVPPEMLNRLASVYEIDSSRASELAKLAVKNLESVRIDTSEQSEEVREAVFAFARLIPTLSESGEDLEKLRQDIDAAFSRRS